MKKKNETLSPLIRELVEIMERKNVLEQFKSFAQLSPSCSMEDVYIHLWNQCMQMEHAKRLLTAKLIQKKSKNLTIVFGEIAQSFEKSIFANQPAVNGKNSFLNSKHLKLLVSCHQMEDSITDRLCEAYDTLVIDIYGIPLPTDILATIRSEMRKRSLTQRILQLQAEMLQDLIEEIQPNHVRFTCRYKSLLADSTFLVEELRSYFGSITIEFNKEHALSGYRGLLDEQKWLAFMTDASNNNYRLN
jgi:hypothetical protein